MAAPIGNDYYKIRSKDGRDKKYTLEQLVDGANEYFQWCQDNPLKEETLVKYKDSYETIGMAKMRPFTLHGLCNYLDIAVSTFDLYSHSSEGFMEVTTRIRQIVYNQKFEGAASGFLNPNIIARDLGMVDKKELDIKGVLSEEEREKRIAALEDKMKNE